MSFIWRKFKIYKIGKMHHEKTSTGLLLGRHVSLQISFILLFFFVWSTIAAHVRKIRCLGRFPYVTY